MDYPKAPTGKQLPLITVKDGRFHINLDHIVSFEIRNASIILSLVNGGQVMVDDKDERAALKTWLDGQSFRISALADED